MWRKDGPPGLIHDSTENQLIRSSIGWGRRHLVNIRYIYYGDRMIKNIGLLLAIVPIASVVHAQSSVTLAGDIDGGIRYTNSKAGNQFSMNSNGLFTSNRIDFVGREDLGGGYDAHFQLESGFNLGNGALDNTTGVLFNRGAYVGLGGWFGSVNF